MRIALNFTRVEPDRGGAETYVADLCRHLIAAGQEVTLFANRWRAEALPASLRYERVPVQGRTRTARIRSFAENSARVLSQASHDCVIGLINTWHQDILIPQGGVHPASLDANAKRYPAGWRRSLYRLGKRMNPSASLYRAIEARQYDPAKRTRVVAVSKMVRDHLEQHHGVAHELVRVIPNAIDADRLAVADRRACRSGLRARLGLGEDDLVYLFVGHNYRLKGLGPLLEALAFRRLRHPDGRPIHLVACGGGDSSPFRSQADRLGLGPTVHFLGFLPAIKTAYHAADAFVLPTYYDPCSLVVLEALASGLPVITTAQNGAGELITPGREGYVVPTPDSIEVLAEALDRLTDDVRRARMGRSAEALGRAQSFDRHVRLLLDLCWEVAVSRRPVYRRMGAGRVGSTRPETIEG